MQPGFNDFKLNPQLLAGIEAAGFTAPTPIQARAIKPVLAGQDIFGIAPTGTGKTAAYAIPLLMQLGYPQGDTPRLLVLAPTRELVIQIKAHIDALAVNTGLRTVSIYGGTGTRLQKQELGNGCDILCATPGRFLDLYGEANIDVRQIKYLVLDEADKMMDMGFIKALHRILEVLPRKRQNLLFSATMSALVEKIAGDFLKFPTRIEAAPQATTAHTVEQVAYEVPNMRTKISLLEHLMETLPEVNKVIIFCKTRQVADNIYAYLERRFGADEVRVIHANKNQNTRLNSINSFRNEDVRVLVATDVVARGIDIPMVSHVVNFDVPIVIEDYVHRIGRTGRANQTGMAITFYTPAERWYLNKIEKLIRQPVPQAQMPPNVFITETPFAERQAQAREIDHQKRTDNPDFKGAFHEKKFANTAAAKKPAAKKPAAKSGKNKAKRK